jgi:hypothetical protein
MSGAESYRERAITFGEDGALVGVITEPAARTNRPAVVLWNAGLLHRVGPSRLNVELARGLAAEGFCSLRFDLSGLGDSGVARTAGVAAERNMGDLRAALDYLQQQEGVAQAILIGLCSAADLAHRMAVADGRVCGLVALDGYAYPTAGFVLRRVAAFARDPRRLAGFVRRRVRRLLARGVVAAPTSSMEDQFRWYAPPRAQAQADLAGFVGRGLRLLYVYSGEAFYYYNHAGQFWKMYPGLDFRGLAAAEYYPSADHLFTQAKNRADLIARIRRWAREGCRG